MNGIYVFYRTVQMKNGKMFSPLTSDIWSLVSGLWSLVSGLWSLVSSGGALPPGALANEMRKNRPNQAYQTVLGIKLSPLIVCALGESAPPPTSDLRPLVSGLRSSFP